MLLITNGINYEMSPEQVSQTFPLRVQVAQILTLQRACGLCWFQKLMAGKAADFENHEVCATRFILPGQTPKGERVG